MPDHRRRPDSAAKKKRAAETTDPHPNPDDPTPASAAARATESVSRKSSRKAPPAVTEEIATDRRNPGASDGPPSRRPHIKISLTRKAAAKEGAHTACDSDNDRARTADDAADSENEPCE